ncbi:serine hydrolase [Kribbella sp. NPDC056345]|uniref:serine hydrolase domain-containing protein n=1 Tax=Kribbella sp. NPDC056345 TaxID=3345789 RepID=UPI0035D9FB54
MAILLKLLVALGLSVPAVPLPPTEAGVPGVAYAVVGAEGIQQQATSGVDGHGQNVGPGTPFLWGSVSKPVTATLAVLLARDGVLDLDSAVATVLPPYPTARMTVRQLLDHTSGLPAGLQLTDRYDEDRSITSVIPQIADLEPISEPGKKHSYSSLNYIVLGAVVEAVTRQPFAQVLSERLLRPAQMSPTLADADRTLPPGHRYVFGTARPFKTQIDPATVPAGYLAGSVADLAAYARTQLPGGPVLTDKERALLHTPRADNNGYALGWRTSQIPGTNEPMIWHAGATPGYQAAILLLPQRRQAVVVLQNAYGPFHDARLLDTAQGIASRLAGTTPERHDIDPAYPTALAALSLVTALLLAFTIGTAVRLFRGPKPGPRKPRLIKLALTVLTLGALTFALASLPTLAGLTRAQLPLWAPDLAWLVHAGLILAPTLAVLRVLTTANALKIS